MFVVPEAVDDEERCREFCSVFLRELPQHAKAIANGNNTTLAAYVRRSLLVVEEYHSRYDDADVEMLVAECLSALFREKYEGLVAAAQSLAARSSLTTPDPAHPPPERHHRPQSSGWTAVRLTLFLSFLCSVGSAVIIGVALTEAHNTARIVALSLTCAACALSLTATRSLIRRCNVEAANAVLLADVIPELLEASCSRSSTVTNPLTVTTSIGNYNDDDGGNTFGTFGGAASFLIEPNEVHARKGQIDAILMETDDDDGQILVRTRGFSKVAVSLGALNNHLLLVVTDLEGKVTYWNEGAALICGFSARDAEGKHISSFLVGDATLQQYHRMTDAAVNGVEPAARLLSVANLTHGSVSVRASVVMAKSAESEGTIGFVFLASSQESDAMRGVSQFHQYFVSDLLQTTPREDSRRKVLESLKWKTLVDLAQCSRDWSSVMLQAVLSDVVKDRHRKCDVRIQPNVSEVLICDQGAVTRAIVQTLQLLDGKIRMQVSQRRCTDTVQQLVVHFTHSSHVRSAALAEVQRSVSEIGCDLQVVEDNNNNNNNNNSNNVIRLHIPFVNEGGNAADSVRPRGEQGTSASPTTQPPMTILLLEKNAVYRHNLSTIAWGSGHSLRVVDSLSKALKSVNDSSVDLGCAIIDADIRDADKLVEALSRHKIFTIETSESAESPSRGHASFLVKPPNRLQLEKELERASLSIRDRKKADEEILRQREVFGKVRNSPWTRGRKLGRGAFADVYEATSTMTGGKMAVKMIRLVGEFKERVKDLMNEIEILCSLSHPHIVHYFYCERAETTINLFMELADEGSLADLLSVQSKLTEDQLAVITKQLLLAVNYLHDHGIIHRDIKPGNMLVSKGKIKLSDFGTATNSVMGEGTQGTIFYMAPEVLDGNTYGKECDIWSIGCVMCECLGIKRPARQSGLLGFGTPSSYPPEISLTLQDFISLCVQEDPSERPTAGSLLLHDFIVGRQNETSQIGRHPAVAMTAQTWGVGDVSGANLSVSSSNESRASW